MATRATNNFFFSAFDEFDYFLNYLIRHGNFLFLLHTFNVKYLEGYESNK